MSQANVVTVERMLEAFNRGDVDAVLATFDEECQIDEPPEMPDSPTGGRHGHAGVREWMTNLRDIAGVRFEQRKVETAGDVVLGEWAATGLGQASGVPVEWTTFAVVHVRGGRILRAQGFLTEAEARNAAGLTE